MAMFPARPTGAATASVTAAHAGSAARVPHHLPGDIKATEERAELADGILTVAAPKSEAAGPSRIEVTGRPQSNG
jgi:hypothetical protein